MQIDSRVVIPLTFILPVAFFAVTIAAQQTSPALTHFAHVTTGFDGAPDGRGLSLTAAEEVSLTMLHANFAAGNLSDLDAMKTQLRHVLYLLDPQQGGQGPGLGFGVKRAAEAIVSHIEMAVAAEGASEILRVNGSHVAAVGRALAARAENMAGIARRALAAETAPTAAPLVEQLRELALQLDTGVDLNGNGRIDPEDEAGMMQLEAYVYLILEGERLPRILQ